MIATSLLGLNAPERYGMSKDMTIQKRTPAPVDMNAVTRKIIRSMATMDATTRTIKQSIAAIRSSYALLARLDSQSDDRYRQILHSFIPDAEVE